MKTSTKYIIALTNLYGIVSREKVIEIHNMQNKRKIDKLQYSEQELKDNFIETYKNYFVIQAIFENNDINYHLKMKKGKPYYIPEKEELLKYQSSFHFDINMEYAELIKYLHKNICDNDLRCAENLAEDIQGICQFGYSTSAVFNYLESRQISFKNEKEVHELLQVIVNLANNTRIWENNGHTPKEIASMFKK